jgi:2-oxoisovalerate dehydrogenase E1 component
VKHEAGQGPRAHERPWGCLERAEPARGTSDATRRARRAHRLAAWPAAELREDLRLVHLSRALEDRELALHRQGRVHFQIAGAGHEVLLVALAHSLRVGRDWFFPYYRDRALVLALGVTPYDMLLQAVGAAADPASGGRQMPCHFGDPARRIVTQSSPTGSQCLPAVGCAEAIRYAASRPHLGLDASGDEIVYVSLGEGATSQGEFWESLNTACRLHLPVLYLVADNGYAISVRAADQAPAPVFELVRGFRGLAVTRVDGHDYAACRERGALAVARVRAGEGPGLLYARVPRPYSHSASDAQATYRDPAELDAELAHDPIAVFERDLVAASILGADEPAAIAEACRRAVLKAADRALEAVQCDPATVTAHLVELPDEAELARRQAARQAARRARLASAPDRAQEAREGVPSDARTTPSSARAEPSAAEPVVLAEAIRRALVEIMEGDERVRVFGEDVADAEDRLLGHVEGKGGVFGVTKGLQRRFGSARCYNTPLAEANIVGRGIGQAIRGLRPCAEIQFFDYIWPAMQQLKSEAATIRWRSNGGFCCPLVVRAAIGGYLRGGAIWHSQCGEAIFAHVPGLLIAFPSRAADAVGLLRAAFLYDDPVLFLEHKHLYRDRAAADSYPPPEHLLAFGRGVIRRQGSDVTVVTWGATVAICLEAAVLLASEGVSVEVIDLRTIAPFDRELVAASVERTGRLLVVHEDNLTAGFGAEVAAFAASECFWSLDAPVRRLAALDVPVPYSPLLEQAVLPQRDDVVAALRELVAI